MLSKRPYLQRRMRTARRQDGVVLIVALVVLVVMTLAGIALMRSMDTSTAIAGNMAFKQAATNAADAGIESAIAWLENSNAVNGLNQSNTAAGYLASTANNANLPLGEKFWTTLSASGVCNLNKFGQGCIPSAEANANGNQLSYMIQRLCSATGSANGAGCAVVAGTVVSSGNNEGAGEEQLSSSFSTVYYRITVRVVGPRNSVSYVQSMVFL